MRVIIGLCVVLTSAVAAAHDCKPLLVAEAEFGPRELGDKTSCPNVPSSGEQSCDLVDGGVTYGVSEGLIVSKSIEPQSFSKQLPFSLAWKEKLEAVSKEIAAKTKGRPPLFLASNAKGHTLSTDTCLLNKKGVDYSMTLSFDDERQLIGIKAQIVYP